MLFAEHDLLPVERYGARRWYDEDLLELFSSVGRISGNVISARVGHQT